MSKKRSKKRVYKKKPKLINVPGIEKVIRKHVMHDDEKLFNKFSDKYKEAYNRTTNQEGENNA